MSRRSAVVRKLVRNTLYGAGGRLLGLAVALVLTPYVVARLGGERYGLYALASVVSGYLALADLGLGTGYVKFVAEAAAHGDEDGVNEVLASGMWAHLGLGALILATWQLLGDAVIEMLGVAQGLRDEAHAGFTLAVVVVALSGAAAAIRAVLWGLQRIDIAARIGVALIVPRVFLVVAVLESGGGVAALVATDLAMFVVGTAVMAIVARQLFPSLDLGPRRLRRATLVRMFSYGVRLQLSRLAEMVNFHLDKLLLARFVGLTAVTDYALGAKVAATARSLPLLGLSAAVPAVSELDADGDRDAVAALARRALGYLHLASVPLFVLVAVQAPRLVFCWLGPGHADSALVIRVLAAGYLLNVLSGAYTTVCQGVGRTGFQARLAVVGLVANVILSSALVVPYGLAGVLVGTSAALGLAMAYARWRFPAVLDGAHAPLPVRRWLLPLAAATVATAAACGLDRLLVLPGGRLWQVVALVVASLTFGVVYATGLWLLGGVAEEDRTLVRELLSRSAA